MALSLKRARVSVADDAPQDALELARADVLTLTQQAAQLRADVEGLEAAAAAELHDVDAHALTAAAIARAESGAQLLGRRDALGELERRLAVARGEVGRLEAEERERQADAMREALRAHADEVMASAHDLLGELQALESEAKALEAFRRVGPFGAEPRPWRKLHDGLEMALGAVHFRESMARNAAEAVLAEQERQARRAAERQQRVAQAAKARGRQTVPPDDFDL
jgi:hypothetical protein